MNLDLLPLATAVVPAAVPAVVASWVTYRFGRAQGRQDRDSARREQAAAALTEPLREMRRLVRRHGCVDIAPHEVPDVFIAWFDAFDRQRTRLPDGWQHLGRSIRAAVGVVFGASSFIDLRPDVDTHPLDAPDSIWQLFADDYLNYSLDSLALWADDDPRAPKALMDYDKWLVRTGRREPIG